MRAVDALRCGWGVVLVTVPRPVLRFVGAPSADAGPVAVARLLGARQVVQGGVLALLGDDRTRCRGAVVDGLHAASGVLLAVLAPSWRIVAGADATLAGAFTATGLQACRRRRGGPGHTRPSSTTGGTR